MYGLSVGRTVCWAKRVIIKTAVCFKEVGLKGTRLPCICFEKLLDASLCTCRHLIALGYLEVEFHFICLFIYLFPGNTAEIQPPLWSLPVRKRETSRSSRGHVFGWSASSDDWAAAGGGCGPPWPLAQGHSTECSDENHFCVEVSDTGASEENLSWDSANDSAWFLVVGKIKHHHAGTASHELWSSVQKWEADDEISPSPMSWD